MIPQGSRSGFAEEQWGCAHHEWCSWVSARPFPADHRIDRNLEKGCSAVLEL